MDHAVEASLERVRDHLRRPIPGRRNLLMNTAGNTVSEIDPGLAALRPAEVCIVGGGLAVVDQYVYVVAGYSCCVPERARVFGAASAVAAGDVHGH